MLTPTNTNFTQNKLSSPPLMFLKACLNMSCAKNHAQLAPNRSHTATAHNLLLQLRKVQRTHPCRPTIACIVIITNRNPLSHYPSSQMLSLLSVLYERKAALQTQSQPPISEHSNCQNHSATHYNKRCYKAPPRNHCKIKTCSDF